MLIMVAIRKGIVSVMGTCEHNTKIIIDSNFWKSCSRIQKFVQTGQISKLSQFLLPSTYVLGK